MARLLRSPLMGGLRYMSQEVGEKVSIASKVRPSAMEKRFMVWAGKYKTTSEIPEFVPPETVEKANSKARIRITNYMIGFAIVGSVISVIGGKRAVERGESTHKSSLDWHEQLKKDHELTIAKTQ